MMAPNLEGAGLDPKILEDGGGDLFAEAVRGFRARRDAGELGFLELPHDSETAQAVQDLADGFGQWFETVVVLGIGGSALGCRTLRDALLGSRWNEGTSEEREYYPKLYVLDNPDPVTVRELLDRLDLRRTLFNVISKSGATAETMAAYLVAAERVAADVGADKARGHFIFTTDPENGALRRMAREGGVPALAIPPNVGGRFSVLSPVGLLPAAVTGIPVDELLTGAAAMADACASEDVRENPAGLLALLLHQADVAQGARIHVIMPYADRLRSLGLWFQQLWAESLGKSESVGPTPLPAVGTVDQHAQVQLFMEGPRDKAVMFIEVEDADVDPLTLADVHPEVPELAYLVGHSMKELLEAERRATAEALRRGGRMNLTLTVPELTPHALGELFMLLEMATVYAGALYGVNPLDQPGVELGKQLTYGLLGREGHERPTFPEDDGAFTL
jgi:glucose-6-phosphate isomerase